MKKILIFTIGTFVLSGLALSAQVGSHRAFGDGEKLVYAVSYKVSFVNTDVAEVSFLTNFNSSKGTPVYKIEANGKTYPFYKWFFDLNDTYTSTLDSATLRPLELKTELKEGKYRYSSRFHYDWENKKVHTAYRNHKNPDSTYKSLKLTEGSYDALALFFNLRCADLSQIEAAGGSGSMKLVLEDTIRTIGYRFLGRENKHIRGAGKFRTLKFRCQMATSTGESFEDGDEFTLWVSDDKNRIPIYVESPIRVGSIRARLIEWKNLRYPLDSKIN